MERFHLVRRVLGGSDVYDENGNQVGYSLPSILGDGEDFYDMDGRPVGQSFDSTFGGEGFSGVGNGSFGYIDEEIIVGRNAWLHGNPFEKEEEPSIPDFGADPSFDADHGLDTGDGFDSGPDWDGGLD